MKKHLVRVWTKAQLYYAFIQPMKDRPRWKISMFRPGVKRQESMYHVLDFPHGLGTVLQDLSYSPSERAH